MIKKMQKFKKPKIWLNEKQKALAREAGVFILELAIAGIALPILMTEASVAYALRPFARKKYYRLEHDDLKKVVAKIKKDEIVRIVKKDGTEYLEITNRGRRQLIEYNIDTISIKKRKWDKLWRIVAFDIPEKYKDARAVLREKLKEIGFKKLQKSVWIYPHECKKEIDYIASIYGVGEYVNYIEATKTDSDEALRKSFNL